MGRSVDARVREPNEGEGGMSARRHYTIECDGPNCFGFINTDKPFVAEARAEADAEEWFKTGTSREGSLDFCTASCKRAYDEVRP